MAQWRCIKESRLAGEASIVSAFPRASLPLSTRHTFTQTSTLSLASLASCFPTPRCRSATARRLLPFDQATPDPVAVLHSDISVRDIRIRM